MGTAEPSVRLERADLAWIRIDHQIQMEFWSAYVTISTGFSLTNRGVNHRLDPEDRAGLGPLLAIYPTELISGTEARGTLSLEFSDGVSISVPQDRDYEAWAVNLPSGFR